MNEKEKLLHLLNSILVESENEQEEIKKEKSIEIKKLELENENLTKKLELAEKKNKYFLMFTGIIIILSLIICAFFGIHSINKAYETFNNVTFEFVLGTDNSTNDSNNNNNTIYDNKDSNILIDSFGNTVVK